jgi:hypothetical protein
MWKDVHQGHVERLIASGNLADGQDLIAPDHIPISRPEYFDTGHAERLISPLKNLLSPGIREKRLIGGSGGHHGA